MGPRISSTFPIEVCAVSIGIHIELGRLSDLIFEVYRGVEKGHFGVDRLAHQFSLTSMEELAHFCIPISSRPGRNDHFKLTEHLIRWAIALLLKAASACSLQSVTLISPAISCVQRLAGPAPETLGWVLEINLPPPRPPNEPLPRSPLRKPPRPRESPRYAIVVERWRSEWVQEAGNTFLA